MEVANVRKLGRLHGQAFVVSNEQKLDRADMFYMITLPTNLRKPHLMPQLPQSFSNAIEAYSVELKSIAMNILNVMAKALYMKPEEMEVLFEEGRQSMRMNYYPPCPQPEQIKKDGIWIPIKPLPSAFVINIGDVLEVVTNGTYRSVEHRGVVNSVKERMSIAAFLGPNLDGEFGPAFLYYAPEPLRLEEIL